MNPVSFQAARRDTDVVIPADSVARGNLESEGQNRLLIWGVRLYYVCTTELLVRNSTKPKTRSSRFLPLIHPLPINIIVLCHSLNDDEHERNAILRYWNRSSASTHN